jgi:hypothetical protein
MPNEQELTDQQKRCLAEVYRFLLSLPDQRSTAGGDEFGDLAQPAVSNVPATEDEHDDTIHQFRRHDK